MRLLSIFTLFLIIFGCSHDDKAIVKAFEHEFNIDGKNKVFIYILSQYDCKECVLQTYEHMKQNQNIKIYAYLYSQSTLIDNYLNDFMSKTQIELNVTWKKGKNIELFRLVSIQLQNANSPYLVIIENGNLTIQDI